VSTLNFKSIHNNNNIEMLNKIQKEALVVMLLLQDKTIREIAKEAHMSFSEIGAIKRRIEEPYNERIKN
jgi:uncharacterized protein YerC